MALKRIHLKSGDTRRILLRALAQDRSGPENLTGVVVRFAAGLETNDGYTVLIQKDNDQVGGVNIVGAPAGGLVEILLSVADSEALEGAYVLEVELTYPDGSVRSLDFADEHDEPQFRAMLWVEGDMIQAA